MVVQEAYMHSALAANSNTPLFAAAGVLAGFYCTSPGNLNIQNSLGVDVIPVHAVSVGWSNIPVALGRGCTIILSGGCAGTAFFQA